LELLAKGRILLAPRNGAVFFRPRLSAAQMIGMEIGRLIDPITINFVTFNPRERAHRARDIIYFLSRISRIGFINSDEAACRIIDIIDRLPIDDGFHAFQIAVIDIGSIRRAYSIGRARDGDGLIAHIIGKGEQDPKPQSP